MFVDRPKGLFTTQKRLDIAGNVIQRVVLREVALQRACFSSISAAVQHFTYGIAHLFRGWPGSPQVNAHTGPGNTGCDESFIFCLSSNDNWYSMTQRLVYRAIASVGNEDIYLGEQFGKSNEWDHFCVQRNRYGNRSVCSSCCSNDQDVF